MRSRESHGKAKISVLQPLDLRPKMASRRKFDFSPKNGEVFYCQNIPWLKTNHVKLFDTIFRRFSYVFENLFKKLVEYHPFSQNFGLNSVKTSRKCKRTLILSGFIVSLTLSCVQKIDIKFQCVLDCPMVGQKTVC